MVETYTQVLVIKKMVNIDIIYLRNIERKTNVVVEVTECGCSNIYKVEKVNEKWSKKYKKSINCNNPKGFSQKYIEVGRKKK